ncbi:PulJ/GspJ family protein [Deinococcus ficus]|uniref:PulJ/GspJ family protein n=1 Tax=Deinococcus ficus TaxID=317577 RepID=UPI0003B3D09C|nr:prepilin-type N-terminal cleavage/methylation domain-containing protein [Deinococcus ficus]
MRQPPRPVQLWRAGFTLIELLVAMALMGIVLFAVASFFTQGSRVSSQSNSRAELQQEILTAQQVIAGRLREAFYVYPPGKLVSLPTLPGHPTANPFTGGTAWTVQTHPVLAMILPPAPGTAEYRFFAYYPVLRSTWVAQTSGANLRAKNPGEDGANASAWVLAEYRAPLPGYAPQPFDRSTRRTPGGVADTVSTLVWPGAAAAALTPQANAQANLVADYLRPVAGGSPPLFAYQVQSVQGGAGTMQVVTGVTLNLNGQRQRGGLVKVETAMAVFPPNIGKVPTL